MNGEESSSGMSSEVDREVDREVDKEMDREVNSEEVKVEKKITDLMIQEVTHPRHVDVQFGEVATMTRLLTPWRKEKAVKRLNMVGKYGRLEMVKKLQNGL